MLWIISILFLVLIVVGTLAPDDDIRFSILVPSSICGVVSILVTLISLACYNDTVSTVDTRMKVLEEQNKIVMNQIEPIVENYMQYEQKTFADCKLTPEKAIAFCSMYPELKANTLVQKQIDIIMSNQDEIKKLKLEKASLNAYHLWLFTTTYQTL